MGLLNKGARWVAGKTVVENDDVELGEENRGLIVGMDAEDRDMDAPPAYEGLEGARDKYLGMGNESSANGFNWVSYNRLPEHLHRAGPNTLQSDW